MNQNQEEEFKQREEEERQALEEYARKAIEEDEQKTTTVKEALKITEAESVETPIQEKLYELYYEQKLSLQKIGVLYGKPREYIHRRMRKYGFKTRTRPEAWKHRGSDDVYEINEAFFHNWSKEMAYILGFILTDGNISDDNNQVGRL